MGRLGEDEVDPLMADRGLQLRVGQDFEAECEAGRAAVQVVEKRLPAGHALGLGADGQDAEFCWFFGP
jgi:hypothetical protein